MFRWTSWGGKNQRSEAAGFLDGKAAAGNAQPLAHASHNVGASLVNAVRGENRVGGVLDDTDTALLTFLQKFPVIAGKAVITADGYQMNLIQHRFIENRYHIFGEIIENKLIACLDEGVNDSFAGIKGDIRYRMGLLFFEILQCQIVGTASGHQKTQIAFRRTEPIKIVIFVVWFFNVRKISANFSHKCLLCNLFKMCISSNHIIAQICQSVNEIVDNVIKMKIIT